MRSWYLLEIFPESPWIPRGHLRKEQQRLTARSPIRHVVLVFHMNRGLVLWLVRMPSCHQILHITFCLGSVSSLNNGLNRLTTWNPQRSSMALMVALQQHVRRPSVVGGWPNPFETCYSSQIRSCPASFKPPPSPGSEKWLYLKCNLLLARPIFHFRDNGWKDITVRNPQILRLLSKEIGKTSNAGCFSRIQD